MRICLLCIVKQTDVYGYITERFKSLMHFLKKKNCLRVLLSLVSSFLCLFFFVQPLNRKFLHIGTWKVNHICFKVNM